MIGNPRVSKIVDHLLAGAWLAILALGLSAAFCGCTEPNPAYMPVQGPIRGGTEPGAVDGGARPDSGAAPDVTAPPRDAAPAPDFLAMQEIGQPASDAAPSGCPAIVASCAGQKRGVLCSRPSCSGSTETHAGQCDGAGRCDPGPEASCSPGVCMGASCARPCGGSGDCGAGSVCMLGTCVPCGGAP